jgi:hypothetical protein
MTFDDASKANAIKGYIVFLTKTCFTSQFFEAYAAA